MGIGPEPFRLAVAVALCVLAAVWDLRERRIPNALTGAGAGLGLLLAGATGGGGLLEAVAAGAAALACVGAVRWLGHAVVGEPGMGWGDAKLAGALGLLLGWPALWALYLAVLLGALVGVAARVAGRLQARQRIPFAPFVFGGVSLALVLPASCVLPHA